MSSDDRQCRLIQSDPGGAGWDDSLRAHAAACPACAAYLAETAELGERLRSLPSLAAPMPQALRARLLAQLAEAGGPVSPRVKVLPKPLRRTFVPVALAASLVLGVFLGHHHDFGFSKAPAEVNRTIGMYIEDVTHDHYLIERIGRPLEVAITDREALSQWLSESLRFQVELPRTTRAFRLDGGRVWHTVGRLSAMASYDSEDGGRVILFAVPANNLELRGATSAMIKGRRVFAGQGWDREARVWIEDDLAMALVAVQGRMPDAWADTFLP